MNFIKKTLLAFGCVLAFSAALSESSEQSLNFLDITFNTNFITLSANSNEKSPSFFDIIFDKSELNKYSEQISKDIEKNSSKKDACWLKYKERNANTLIVIHENILKCMTVTERDLRKYFKKHDQDKFEADFNKDLMKCISSTSISTKVMNCYVDTICDYLNKVKGDDDYISKKDKKCVRLQLEDYLKKVNASNGELNRCLEKV